MNEKVDEFQVCGLFDLFEKNEKFQFLKFLNQIHCMEIFYDAIYLP